MLSRQHGDSLFSARYFVKGLMVGLLYILSEMDLLKLESDRPFKQVFHIAQSHKNRQFGFPNLKHVLLNCFRNWLERWVIAPSQLDGVALSRIHPQSTYSLDFM